MAVSNLKVAVIPNEVYCEQRERTEKARFEKKVEFFNKIPIFSNVSKDGMRKLFRRL